MECDQQRKEPVKGEDGKGDKAQTTQQSMGPDAF